MKLTNKFNIPQTFVNVIKRPTYNKGKVNVSATELINSPRIVAMKQKHWEELEQDVSEMIWSIWGSAVHTVLEHGRDEHHIVEQRLSTEFEGWSLSGAIDLQEVEEDGIIINDYKVTGAWSVMNEKKDWVYQQNIYAWLVERVKRQHVKAIRIVAIIRDWSARDASTREGYPPSPVVVINLELWPYEQREEFVRQRLRAHNEAHLALVLGETLPHCTTEEMWERPSMWAVKKEGAVRAKSVHSTEEEAQNVLDQMKNKQGYSIEHRPGERVRCASYCQVSKFCDQYQKYLESK
jgi:hypothetical protein